MSICEKCGKEHDGSYGSGRFCCAKCARSYSSFSKRDEINNKVSATLKGRPGRIKSSDEIRKWKDTFTKNHWNKIKDNFVVMYNGDILDITNEQLQNYRATHTVCEICGNQETGTTFKGNKLSSVPNRLTIDHDHNTLHFRGLLCKNCNSRLGWFEHNMQTILDYLNKK